MIKKILLILFFSLNANAALEVTIAQGKVEPTPIAITQIFGADSDTARYGNTLRQIINNNLTNSGLFYTVNEDLYIQSDNLVEKVPRFEDWKLIKAQFLLSADVSKTDKGIRLRMRLYDVFNAKEIEKLQLTIPPYALIGSDLSANLKLSILFEFTATPQGFACFITVSYTHLTLPTIYSV